tara:strand:- start:3919 stop:4173 length:255 start_codon:yes stop_codon:yes gene_type:complete
MDPNKIREALTPEMKDKMDSMTAKDRMEFVYSWVKHTRFLYNTLSREGKQKFIDNPNTPIEEYNRADKSAINYFKEKMDKWLSK